MSRKLKGAILGILIAGACVCAAFAFTDPGYADTDVESTAVSENCYVLRDYEGHVAVYVENDPSCPMTVTDIDVNTLRELDRQTLQTGIKIKSKERLMMLLEDLGS